MTKAVSQTEIFKILSSSRTSQPAYALLSVHDGLSDVEESKAYLRSLGLALAQWGCQVDIFIRREDPQQPAIVEHAPGCRTICLTAGPTEYLPKDELFEYLPVFVQAWLTFQRQSGRQYHLIHTSYWLSSWVGAQLKSQLGLPWVHTYQAIGVVKKQEKNSLNINARLLTEWGCLQQADCVVATTLQEKKELRWFVSEQERIQLIPWGIDTQPFASLFKETARQRLGILPQTSMILFVGDFACSKEIKTLLRACLQLPARFQLYLVNRNTTSNHRDRQRIKALVEEWELESMTTSIEFISPNRLPAYYTAADVCVVPSDRESFGLTAMEAMAAGTPVVANYLGRSQHIILHGKTGLLVPPHNPDALAFAIWALLDNPKLARAWGEAGWKRVQSHFNRITVAARLHQLYQSLTQK